MYPRKFTKSQNNEKVMIGIDFGTSGTAFSYAFSNENENDILSPEELKSPTEIILDSNMKCLAFGKNCKQFLREGKMLEQKCFHFSDIKMKLYKNERRIQANNDSSFHDLQTVISQILIEIKKEALNIINSKRGSPIFESNIEWKLTVPAIWREKSKEIMIKAAKTAGIFNELITDKSLFLALEPECASLDFINEKSSDKNVVNVGNNYIVCDIGGGTIDISSHTRKINHIDNKIYIEELYPPSGGNKGSTYINKAFMEKVIKKIFGEKALNDLFEAVKNNTLEENEDFDYDDYMNLLEQIEEFKIGINVNSINGSRRINCSVFKNFIEEDISELVRKYNLNCPKKWKIVKYSSDLKIFFPNQIMIDLTKEIIVDNTVNYIWEIIDHVKNINSIIYAGTVSKNSYIISMIQSQLPNKINSCVTIHPSLAVARGAVMFGMNPFVIKSRISRFDIGIRTAENWDEIKHFKRQDLKFFCPIEKCYKCKNIFSSIISKNQNVFVDEWISKKFNLLGSKCDIVFIRTDNDNTIFTDDKLKKCQIFGTIKFDAGNEFDINDKDLLIELKLGGTFVDAKIKYKDVEKSTPVFFNNNNDL